MAETRPKRILVVEDDPGYRDFFCAVLSPVYDVTMCETLEDALEKIEALKFDAILSDINLDAKTGLELLMTLRRKGRLEESPLLVCSSQSDAGTRQIVEGMGASGFIEKPCSADVLLSRIDLALKKAP